MSLCQHDLSKDQKVLRQPYLSFYCRAQAPLLSYGWVGARGFPICWSCCKSRLRWVGQSGRAILFFIAFVVWQMQKQISGFHLMNLLSIDKSISLSLSQRAEGRGWLLLWWPVKDSPRSLIWCDRSKSSQQAFGCFWPRRESPIESLTSTLAPSLSQVTQ